MYSRVKKEKGTCKGYIVTCTVGMYVLQVAPVPVLVLIVIISFAHSSSNVRTFVHVHSCILEEL